MAIYYIRKQMSLQESVKPMSRISERRSSDSDTHDNNYRSQHRDLRDVALGFEEREACSCAKEEGGSHKELRRTTSEGQYSDNDEHFQSDLPDDFVPSCEQRVPSSYEQSIPIEHFIH